MAATLRDDALKQLNVLNSEAVAKDKDGLYAEAVSLYEKCIVIYDLLCFRKCTKLESANVQQRRRILEF